MSEIFDGENKELTKEEKRFVYEQLGARILYLEDLMKDETDVRRIHDLSKCVSDIRNIMYNKLI